MAEHHSGGGGAAAAPGRSDAAARLRCMPEHNAITLNRSSQPQLYYRESRASSCKAKVRAAPLRACQAAAAVSWLHMRLQILQAAADTLLALPDTANAGTGPAAARHGANAACPPCRPRAALLPPVNQAAEQ